ncbi:MAG: efflux RND transporter periplasmic adaptor subunit [Nitrospirae bacterium]|nr:efflux RND transporter periplasmic adaptor subunit [Nitrospirota bacterium]
MANEDLSKLKIPKTAEASRHVRVRIPVPLVAAGVLLVVLLFLYFQGALTPALEVDGVTVSKMYPSQAFTLLNASGYVVAQRKAAVAPKVTATLVWLGVAEGSVVKKGQVIARLENEDVSAQKNQAAANLNVARSNLEQASAELNDAAIALKREKDLLAKGYVAQADYDTAEARYKKAKAAVEGAEASIKAAVAALKGANVAIDYTLVRAPFNAVVLTKDADVGDIVTPIGAAVNAKAAVVTIADMSSLEVEVDVSESNLQQVRMGQPSVIQLDALPEARFRGEVSTIVPTADRSKGTVMVKVRFIDKDARILPEMSAKVSFLSRPAGKDEQTPFTALNPASVANRAGQNVVFLVKGNRAAMTPITLGARKGDMLEITAGVQAGDKIVAVPPAGLKNGSKIKVAEK